MKWLKDFLASLHQPDSKPLFKFIKNDDYVELTDSYKKLRDDYIELQEVFEEISDRLNNAESRASEAEQRMITMATLQNTDLVAEKASHAAKQINDIFVWYWGSLDERTKAVEKTIESLLVEQIKGTPAWTKATDKYKGTVA